MLVERYAQWNPTMKGYSGDFLRVDGIELGHVKDLNGRGNPWFYTGSPYGREILEANRDKVD